MVRNKKWLLLFVALLLLVPSVSFAGSIKGGDPSGTPGQWYVGSTPGYVAPAKHPILFVHGLNSSSGTWWVENNMYDTAYQNGYETAFIDLYPTKTMWDNGALLAQKLRDMYQYFGEKVVIVAHSKGGVDTQSALVHYGAGPYVARVITLSSPHHGSELADLAYSSWAGWLAGILGSKSDATYSLQTGYMDYFRSQTDNHPNVYQIPIYTMGGTEWGSFGSSLYWGGLYLSSYGSNDGAVTVSSSRLPYATELRVGGWNHTTIKEGSSTFNLFKNYLNESQYTIQAFQTKNIDLNTNEETLNGHYIRGGEYNGETKEEIFVENGAEAITVDWISNQPDPKLTFVSPDGKAFTHFKTNQDHTAFLKGSYHHTITIEEPESGKWTLQAASDKKEHYLLNTTFKSPLNDLLAASFTNGEFNVKLKDKDLKAKTTMTIDYYKNGKLKQAKVKGLKKNETLYQLPDLGEGVYNMTVEVDGKYKGENFKRTLIRSAYIDHQGQLYYQ